ncbi:uncharacterized protein DUF3309, partial [Martelella mediterranea]
SSEISFDTRNHKSHKNGIPYDSFIAPDALSDKRDHSASKWLTLQGFIGGLFFGTATPAGAFTGQWFQRETIVMLGTILLIILILLLIGALPRWGYSASWGYGPSGGLGLVLLIVIILLLLGYI